MAIHTLSIGGTSFVIQPKYASSAGYAATAGRASYASSAGRASYASSAGSADFAYTAGTADHAVTASNAKYASSATYATTAGYSVTASNAKYASSAGYAATAGRASYASSAGYASTAETADYAHMAGRADDATYAASVFVTGVAASTNYPLLFTDTVAPADGAYKSLATDTANSLHYNPSTNVLTVPTFYTSSLGVSGGVIIYNGNDLNLQANSTSATDPGDIAFKNSSGTEIGRIWLDRGSVFKLRYGSSDAAKTIIHEGNIGNYLTTQSMKTLKIATSVAAGGNTTYASYNGSSDVTIDWVANAGYASSAAYAGGAGLAHYATTASYAVTAYYAINAGSASNATLAGRAISASYAVSASNAINAGMCWTNVSTSTFYIAGSTSNISGSSTMVKSTGVTVQSNSVRASAGFYETSDARLKTITSDVDVDFERLKSIPKVQYIKKGETAPHIGTIAQDLQKVYPEFVETGDDGYLVVDYAKLSVIPLKAIDILHDELVKVKDEVVTVKAENKMLKERLDNVEKLIEKLINK